MVKKFLISCLLCGMILSFSSNVSLAKTERIYFNYEITQDLVTALENYLDKHLEERDTLELYICSPGGTVTASINLYDYLTMLHTRNIQVITIATGLCASGGTIIFQAGDIRLVTPYSMFLIHKAHKVDEKWYKKVWNRFYPDKELEYVNGLIYCIYWRRSGRDIKLIEKDLSYDHWMRADETIKLGYADEYAHRGKFYSGAKP